MRLSSDCDMSRRTEDAQRTTNHAWSKDRPSRRTFGTSRAFGAVQLKPCAEDCMYASIPSHRNVTGACSRAVTGPPLEIVTRRGRRGGNSYRLAWTIVIHPFGGIGGATVIHGDCKGIRYHAEACMDAPVGCHGQIAVARSGAIARPTGKPITRVGYGGDGYRVSVLILVCSFCWRRISS